MSSSYGENIRLTLFGQSHGPAVGMTLEGIPAGVKLDMEALQIFLDRRAPGRSDLATARKEADIPQFIAGLVDDVTCGAPITAVLPNRDARARDYDLFRKIPRPGHADFTAQAKFHGYQDASGGGHFSGRLTAPLCVAGGICLQLLEKDNIAVMARILSIGNIRDESEFSAPVGRKAFPVTDDAVGEKMQEAIRQFRDEGDSLGGVIQCQVLGLPAGLGDPMFDGMENRIARAAFAVPAVKGIEFGAGFAVAAMKGSQHNDAFVVEDRTIRTRTNHAGGILGGITDGMPLVFNVAIKPTPSIAKAQESVNMETLEPERLLITGRHDPCIVPRAVPCVEAAAALAVYDALLEMRKQRG